MSKSDSGPDRTGGLLWGIALIVLGVAFLLERFGVLPVDVWQLWWPAVVIVMGFVALVTARTPKRMGDGAAWVLFGVWFLMAQNHILGLTWAKSWPLALVAAGMGMVVRAIASAFMGGRDQEVRTDA